MLFLEKLTLAAKRYLAKKLTVNKSKISYYCKKTFVQLLDTQLSHTHMYVYVIF